MAPEQRRPVDRRNREHEVVEAAVKVFYEKGYAASTIQDVADVVGVLKGSLYHYISSKEDLLFRILQQSSRWNGCGPTWSGPTSGTWATPSRSASTSTSSSI